MFFSAFAPRISKLLHAHRISKLSHAHRISKLLHRMSKCLHRISTWTMYAKSSCYLLLGSLNLTFDQLFYIWCTYLSLYFCNLFLHTLILDRLIFLQTQVSYCWPGIVELNNLILNTNCNYFYSRLSLWFTVLWSSGGCLWIQGWDNLCLHFVKSSLTLLLGSPRHFLLLPVFINPLKVFLKFSISVSIYDF